MRLPRSFFNRDTLHVARDLLGCTLVHLLEGGTQLSGRIIETEAYLPTDTASHGYRGRTQRNAPMFMRAGTAYVYFIYGMHFCFNVVTEGEGVPAAVLVRAVQPVDGIEVMLRNRQTSRVSMTQTSRVSETHEVFSLTNGPGKLCQAFGIDRSANGVDLCKRGSRLFIERKKLIGLEDPEPPLALGGGELVEGSGLIEATPRIGISGDDKAKTALWRFVLRNDG